MGSRVIIESHTFKQQQRELRVNIRRFDEAMEQVTALMESAPPYFPQIPDTGDFVIRRAKFADFPGLQPVSIFYIETPEAFTLISIVLIDVEW